MSETQLLASIREALLLTGKVLLWRNNTGRLQDVRRRWVTFGLGIGSPDLVGILKGSGRFVAFEVKTDTGRISVEQEMWHRAARAAGAYVAVVRSVDEAMSALSEAAR